MLSSHDATPAVDASTLDEDDVVQLILFRSARDANFECFPLSDVGDDE